MRRVSKAGRSLSAASVEKREDGEEEEAEEEAAERALAADDAFDVTWNVVRDDKDIALSHKQC